MKLLPPPGPARTRQLLILGVLAIGAVYAMTRVFGSGPAAPAPPASNSPVRNPLQVPAAAPSATAPPPASKTVPQPLAFGKLEPVPEEPATTRNPFRFGVKPTPPPPAAPPRPVVPVTPVPTGPVTPPVPPIPLKFIGRVVLPDKEIVAALSDGKGSVVHGREGQVIDGRYRIVKIGEESIVIEYVNGTGRTTLPLRGS